MHRRKGLSQKKKDQLRAARENWHNKENAPAPDLKARGSSRGLKGQLYTLQQALKAAEKRADIQKRRAEENKDQANANETRYRSERRRSQRLSATVGPLMARATTAETALVEVRKALERRDEETERMKAGYEATISGLTGRATKLATTLDLVRKTNR